MPLLVAAGDHALPFADRLRAWLAAVLDGCPVTVASATDASEVAESLGGSHLVVLCAHPGDLQDPWLHYLLGAAARADTETPHAVLYLLGTTPGQLAPPLSWHTCVAADRAGTRRLLELAMQALGDSAPPRTGAVTAFEERWPELEAAIADALTAVAEPAPPSAVTATFEAADLLEMANRGETPAPAPAAGSGTPDAPKLETVIEALRRSIELSPGDPAAHTTLGNVLFQSGRTPEALAEFRRALDLEPASTTARGGIAAVFASQGRIDDAVGMLRETLEIKPDSASTWASLGQALRRLGRTEEAIAALRRAVELAPRDAGFLAGLAGALRSTGALDEAADCLRRAIHLDRSDAALRMNLGRVLRDQGRLDDAIEVQREAIRLAPDDAHLHKSLATTLRARGDLQQSAESLRRALELDPGQSEVHNELAVTLLALGRLEEAVAELRRSAELSLATIAQGRATVSTYNDLGIAYFHQGKLDESIVALRRALELEPGSERVRQNLERVIHAQRVRAARLKADSSRAPGA